MAHEELKKHLYDTPGKAFVKDMTQRVYSWADKISAEYYVYRVFEELTVRYETGEKTRKGLDKTDHYRFDAVFFIQPGWAALNQKQCYSVGVEIKGSKSDLRQDSKLEKYLGWTDFMFLAVPDELIEEAVKKTESNELIGVLDIEQGLIVKLPKKCQVKPENKLWMYEQIIYNTVFKDIKTVQFKTEEVDVVPAELVDITPKIHPEYNNLSNIDRLKMEEEKAARKAAAQARQEFRQRRAAEMAEKAQQMPEDVRLKLSALSDGAQAAYHILRKNPGMTAIGLEKSMGVGEATARRFVASLTESGLIEHQGSKKSGGYHPTLSDEGLKMAMPKCNTCILFKTVKFNNHESTDRNSSGI